MIDKQHSNKKLRAQWEKIRNEYCYSFRMLFGFLLLLLTACQLEVNVNDVSSDLKLEDVNPKIEHVTIMNPQGVYSVGTTLIIKVKTNKPILVNTANGMPRLELNFLPQLKFATYQSGSGSDVLTFTADVEIGDGVDILNYAGVSSLSANGAEMVDAEGRSLNLSLPLLGTGYDLGSKMVSIDTIAPYAEFECCVPTGTNRVDSLNLSVSNFDLAEYRFVVGSGGSLDCTQASSYGAWTPVNQPLLTSIAALSAGPVKLCLLGRDLAGNEQDPMAPSFFEWTRDLTPPSGLVYVSSTNVYARSHSIAINKPSLFGSSPFTFSINPSLPTGLSIDASTGYISGTPTALLAPTNFTITATNTVGQVAVATISLEVIDESIFSLLSVRENENLAGYKVFSGSCVSGQQVSIVLPALTQLPKGVSSSQFCQNSSFSFGVQFYGDRGPRTIVLRQGEQRITRHISFNPSGFKLGSSGGTDDGIMVYSMDERKLQIYVAGLFSSVRGVSQKSVARLNIDGTVDRTFATGDGFVSGDYLDSVNAIAYDSIIEKLYVGGSFEYYKGVRVNRIARLNRDGSIDTTFNSGLGFNGDVRSIVLHGTEQKIYVAGNFTTYNGEQVNYIVRLNADGSVDNNFAIGTGFDSDVSDLLHDKVRHRLYAVGSFTTYQGVSNVRIAGINEDGSPLSGFDVGVGFNNPPIKLFLDSLNGKVYASGVFSNYRGTFVGPLIRINLDGSIDTTFSVQSGLYDIQALYVDQMNQKIVIGGSFESNIGIAVKRIARLNNDGSVDHSFITGSGFDGTVTNIFSDPFTNKIYVAGYFEVYQKVFSPNLVRIDRDGRLDTHFTSIEKIKYGLEAIVYDGTNQQLYLKGYVRNEGLSFNRSIVRANIDGSIDYSFDVGSGFSSHPVAIALDEVSQKLYVAGEFKTYQGKKVSNLIRLQRNGTIDNSFNYEKVSINPIQGLFFDSSIQKLYAYGYSHDQNWNLGCYLVRLNLDGTLDSSFNNNHIFSYGFITSVTTDSTSHSLYVAGSFSDLDNTDVHNVIKLSSSGVHDTTFSIGPDGFTGGVQKIVFDSSIQKLYVAGTMTSFNGSAISLLVRLNPNGTLDSSFSTGSGFGEAYGLTNFSLDQSQQKLYVGGYFTSYQGVKANAIIRLLANGESDSTFNSGSGFDSVWSQITSILFDSDHRKIFIGGWLPTYNQNWIGHFVFLDEDGSLYNTGLDLSVPHLNVVPNSSQSIAASGGQAPYSYSIVLGGGTINQSGVFVAPPMASRVRVRVQDSSVPPLSSEVTLNVFEPLVSSPSLVAFYKINEQRSLSVAGGLAPLRFELLSGAGTLNENGIFVAPEVAGISLVRVTDSINSYVLVEIRTTEPLQITPSRLKITGGMTTTFVAKGGVAPYSYSLGADLGVIGLMTGVYTAPTADGLTTVYVRDANGNTAISLVEVVGVNSPIEILPASFALAVNSSYHLGAKGGSGHYTFSKISGGGSVDAKGLFTAPAGTGTTIIEVSDGTSTARSTVTIVSAMSFYPSFLTTSIGVPTHLNVEGGVPPYRYQIVGGMGSVQSDGVLTASQVGKIVVNVSDSRNAWASITVDVNDLMQIVAASERVMREGIIKLQVFNGAADYTYSIESGGGELSDASNTQGVVYLKAPASIGVVRVKATDRLQQASFLDIQVTAMSPFVMYPSNSTLIFRDRPITSIEPLLVMGDLPTRYQVKEGCLPAGLSLNETTGVISGTATAGQGQVICSIVVSNSGGYSEALLTMVVQPESSFSIVSPAGGSSVSGFQIFSGACIDDFDVEVTSEDQFLINTVSKNVEPCKDGKFSFGINFWGAVNSSRTMQFRQANKTITQSVIYQPSGWATVRYGPDGPLNKMLKDPDSGKIYIGGNFTAIEGKPSRALARLNLDGSLDSSFDIGEGFDGVGGVRALAIDSVNKKLYVGGYFNSLNGKSYNRLVRLNENGSIDTAFDVGTGLNEYVTSLAFDSLNQKLYVVGYFTTYKGATANRILRLNTDGSVDTQFNVGTGFDNYPTAMAYDDINQKIYIGGHFSSYNGVAANKIIRLNTDGTRDTNFLVGTGFNGGVHALAVDRTNKKVYVGGDFTAYNGTTSTTATKKVALLNDTGGLDTSFSIAHSYTYLYALNFDESNSKLYVGGFAYSPTTVNLARLNANGTSDSTFIKGQGLDTYVFDFLYDSTNQKLYIGGSFTTYDGKLSLYFKRLNQNGSIDTSFKSVNTGFNGQVNVIKRDDRSGKLYVGGNFTSYGEQSVNYLARLNSDGTIDSTFNIGTGFNSRVLAIYIDQVNDKIYVGGGFDSFNGSTAAGIVRLDMNGTIDSGFSTGTGFSGTVNVITLDSSNQKLYVGGSFYGYQGGGTRGLIRLNLNGTIDNGFVVGTGFTMGNYVTTIHQLILDSTNQKLYVGGYFTNYNGTDINHLARLNLNGSVDSTFTIGLSNSTSSGIYAMVLDSTNQRFYIGGTFTNYGSSLRNRLAAIKFDGSLDSSFDPGTGISNSNQSVQTIAFDSAKNRLYVGGLFSIYNNATAANLIALKTDGAVDSSFRVGAGYNNYVFALYLEPSSGELLVGGSFKSYNYNYQGHLSKISDNGSLAP